MADKRTYENKFDQKKEENNGTQLKTESRNKCCTARLFNVEYQDV